jgi:hypothetical protein
MSKPKFETREAWLQAAVEEMTPHFKIHEYSVPPVRVSCGWPAIGGLGKRIGECWDGSVSSDKKAQIFISPILVREDEPYGVLPVLVHEVVHAVVGVKEKHNKVFGKCARAVGLEGKLTATVASTGLLDVIKGWMKSLGPYPHAKLNPVKGPVKKQTTRLIKCECKKCGYIARTTQKWIFDAGPPLCPCNKKPMLFTVQHEGGSDE